MKNKKSIADNIRRIRESLGYSQDYVAIRLDISQQAYSTIEKTPEKSTLSRLRQISEILQVPLVTLLGEDDTIIQQNFNQVGGNAATQMRVQESGSEKLVYERLISELRDQIDFLRSKMK
jgi:transcriptional regulator with XRE-family HTH domain